MRRSVGQDLARLWAAARAVFYAAVAVGAYAALARSKSAAAVVIALLGTAAALQLLAATIGYRRVMRRPWPRAQAVSDDDDDW